MRKTIVNKTSVALKYPTPSQSEKHTLFQPRKAKIYKMLKQATANDDAAGIRKINSYPIGFTQKMKNIKAETDTT